MVVERWAPVHPSSRTTQRQWERRGGALILWKALLAGVASATALGTGFTLATTRTELPKQPDIVQVGITAGGQSAEAMRPWRQPVMPSQDNEGIGTAAASPSGTDSRGARGDDSPDDVRDSVDGQDRKS